MKLSIYLLFSFIGSLSATYVPSDPWQDLKPSSTLECDQEFQGKAFGIVVETDLPFEKREEIEYNHSPSAFRAHRLTLINLVTQIEDGQIQDSHTPQACQIDYITCPENENTLSVTLIGDVLYDKEGRIGSIVANHQFQFDGPVPQAGTIYAAGWGVTKEGYLALGDQTKFYECNSGDFDNLYDEKIASYCVPIMFKVVEFQC